MGKCDVQTREIKFWNHACVKPAYEVRTTYNWVTGYPYPLNLLFSYKAHVNALERDEYYYRFSAPKINANASSQRKNEQLKISYFRNRSATVPCEATAFAV